MVAIYFLVRYTTPTRHCSRFAEMRPQDFYRCPHCSSNIRRQWVPMEFLPFLNVHMTYPLPLSHFDHIAFGSQAWVSTKFFVWNGFMPAYSDDLWFNRIFKILRLKSGADGLHGCVGLNLSPFLACMPVLNWKTGMVTTYILLGNELWMRFSAVMKHSLLLLLPGSKQAWNERTLQEEKTTMLHKFRPCDPQKLFILIHGVLTFIYCISVGLICTEILFHIFVFYKLEPCVFMLCAPHIHQLVRSLNPIFRNLVTGS